MKKNILALQIPSIIADAKANFKNLESYLGETIEKNNLKPDFLFLPEVWSAGWFPDDFEKSADTVNTVEFLIEIAKKYNVNIFGGSYIRKTQEGLKNSMPVITRKGELLGYYDKIHLYSPDGEARAIVKGDKAKIFEIEGLSVGVSICYDIRFPELFRSYINTQNPPSLLVNLSAWPKTRKEQYYHMAASRAIENQCYFLALSQCGEIKDGVYNAGSSCVFDPMGKNIAKLGEEKDFIYFELDDDKVKKTRQTYPNLENKIVKDFGFEVEKIKDKMLKRIFAIVLTVIMMNINSAYAGLFDNSKKTAENEDNSIISVYAQNIANSKQLYSKNKNKTLNTASALKLYTFAAALDTLGENYGFETAFYIKDNNLYLKLGADPLLSKKDLFKLLEKTKKQVNFSNIKYIYIDDKIISQVPYPDGWCSDDYWPQIPPLTPYIIDDNKVKINLQITPDRKNINVIQSDKYRYSIINRLKIAGKEDVKISKEHTNLNNVLTLRGEINDDTEVILPVLDPKTFFIGKLEEGFSKYKLSYNDKFYFKETPKDAKKVAYVSHDIKEISEQILKYSNNYFSEILFRVAGNAYAKNNGINPDILGQSLGTNQNGILMFKNYYSKAGLDINEINICDGSGVSRYNSATTKWLAEGLAYLDKNTQIRKYMQQADEGTLSRRLRYYKGILWAKTGTHFGLSSIVGIIQTSKGKEVSFAIIIQDFNKSSAALKALEDDIIDEIFNL